MKYHDVKFEHKISFKLNIKQFNRLKQLAKKQKTTQSEIIRNLINNL